MDNRRRERSRSRERDGGGLPPVGGPPGGYPAGLPPAPPAMPPGGLPPIIASTMSVSFAYVCEFLVCVR